MKHVHKVQSGLFRVSVWLQGHIYVKALHKEQARERVAEFQGKSLEVPEGSVMEGLVISSASFDSPVMEPISLSPSMILQGSGDWLPTGREQLLLDLLARAHALLDDTADEDALKLAGEIQAVLPDPEAEGSQLEQAIETFASPAEIEDSLATEEEAEDEDEMGLSPLIA